MRVWLDPQKMYARSLTPSDVISAIQAQNQEISAGQLGAPPVPPGQDFQLTVNVNGQLSDPEQFEQIIVKADNSAGGEVTRIRDVGRVELGAQTYSQSINLNNEQTAGIGIYQLPGANALETAQNVRDTMAKLAKRFPEGLEYSMPFDTTVFVEKSIEEVYWTLLEAGALVLIVIIVFLGDWRASLVPATTVPVTIIGAFAAMALMGFNINILTLLALVLAIGIVVDDAIVVVEGVTQHIERAKPPKVAAVDAMRELFGPIVGITLVLMSVFLPAAFMPGVTGQMYRQFALVIAATALISAINAISLKPTQCGQWLRPIKEKQKFILFRWFDWAYERFEHWYARLITHMVRHSIAMSLIALCLVCLSFYGMTRIPTGFIPFEDQGYMLIVVQLPDGASLERTEAVLKDVSDIALKTPGIQDAVAISGMSPLESSASLANAGAVYVIFKDWSERGEGEDMLSIYGNLSKSFKDMQAAKVLVVVPPPIMGLGQSGGFAMQIELIDGSFNYNELQDVSDAMTAAAQKRPEVLAALSPFRSRVPQVSVDINRTQTEILGVSLGDLFETLQAYVGSAYVGQFTKFGQTFQIYVQADENFRLETPDIPNLYVRSQSGDMVPIGAVADIVTDDGPAIVSLYNLYPTSAVNGMPAPGYSTGQAMAALEEIAAQTLPSNMSYEWTAMSYQENLVGNSSYFIFALAVCLVFFVLSGQYESFITPAGVLFAVPLALLGTVGVLLAIGIANNIYVQIGLVLLIALSAKNAILIVEVARHRHAQGVDVRAAAVEAARVRFRPILMTSFAFILGVVPLVIATGAGASARKSLGITVFSGMLASTCLAVLFVPSYYVVLQRYQDWRARKKKHKTAHA
jgi:HAE1 family hydrophobic/amphiphilic exporter-1